MVAAVGMAGPLEDMALVSMEVLVEVVVKFQDNSAGEQTKKKDLIYQ